MENHITIGTRLAGDDYTIVSHFGKGIVNIAYRDTMERAREWANETLRKSPDTECEIYDTVGCLIEVRRV